MMPSHFLGLAALPGEMWCWLGITGWQADVWLLACIRVVS